MPYHKQYASKLTSTKYFYKKKETNSFSFFKSSSSHFKLFFTWRWRAGSG
nr:unnamed protein product [Brassica oleracea]